MHLENVVLDSLDPQRLGRFWEAALGLERLTDQPDVVELRLHLGDGAFLDLCLPQVVGPEPAPLRLHLDLSGGAEQAAVVDRLTRLGAGPADVGQGDAPWVVLADPEGNPFCVMEDRPAYAGTGPLAALPLDSADPARDAAFWAWATGWVPVPGAAPASLRHPSGAGPLLELCHESVPKGPAKNRVHLDVRLDPGEDPDTITAEVTARGGAELHPGWGDLPWRVYADPSGNEFCVLPASP